jgi:hypothetical protein
LENFKKTFSNLSSRDNENEGEEEEEAAAADEHLKENNNATMKAEQIALKTSQPVVVVKSAEQTSDVPKSGDEHLYAADPQDESATELLLNDSRENDKTTLIKETDLCSTTNQTTSSTKSGRKKKLSIPKSNTNGNNDNGDDDDDIEDPVASLNENSNEHLFSKEGKNTIKKMMPVVVAASATPSPTAATTTLAQTGNQLMTRPSRSIRDVHTNGRPATDAVSASTNDLGKLNKTNAKSTPDSLEFCVNTQTQQGMADQEVVARTATTTVTPNV